MHARKVGPNFSFSGRPNIEEPRHEVQFAVDKKVSPDVLSTLGWTGQSGRLESVKIFDAAFPNRQAFTFWLSKSKHISKWWSIKLSDLKIDFLPQDAPSK
jgi:hypothetical protein